MATIEAEKNKRIRIAILEMLKTTYPAAIDEKNLRFALNHLGYPLLHNIYTAHLKYLEEKGYLKRETREGYGFKIGWCVMTADGWDLLDGYLHEDGIGDAL